MVSLGDSGIEIGASFCFAYDIFVLLVLLALCNSSVLPLAYIGEPYSVVLYCILPGPSHPIQRCIQESSDSSLSMTLLKVVIGYP
nr:hypothetical protein CFP56_74880 [Quercus suber]